MDLNFRGLPQAYNRKKDAKDTVFSGSHSKYPEATEGPGRTELKKRKRKRVGTAKKYLHQTSACFKKYIREVEGELRRRKVLGDKFCWTTTEALTFGE